MGEEAERERPGRQGALLSSMREQAASGGRAAWEAHGARAMATMATVREERKRADRRGPHGRDLIFSRFPFLIFKAARFKHLKELFKQVCKFWENSCGLPMS